MRQDWKYLPLGELCDVLDSKRKPITKNKRQAGSIPYYGATGVLDYVKDYIFDEKLVLLGEDGAKWGAGENSAYIINGKTWVNNHAHALRPHRDIICDEFLVCYLNYTDLSDSITGVTVPKLNQEKMRAITIPVPPLSEQERIVALVDDQFAKIDQLKANADLQLRAAKDLFQSALKQLLTPKEGWEIKTLGEICEVTDYVANGSFATLKENVTYYNEPNYAILVRLADYSSSFDKTKFVYVDKHSYDFLSKSSLFGGEIIMSNVGSIGKCFICPDLGQPMTIGPNSLLIRTPNPPYFHYYFQSQLFQDKLKTITSQATLSKFNKTQFRDLSVFLPPLPEQERIAARLDAISEKVKALQANYDQTITLCNDLKQALLKSIFA